MNSKILILSYSNLKNDARVLRQILALKDVYEVSACGLESPEIEGVHFISIYKSPPFSVLRKVNRLITKLKNDLENWYWNVTRINLVEELSLINFDVIIANDINTLPIASKLAELGLSKVYYDAHEYSAREFEHDQKWVKTKKPLIDFLCEKYIPKTNYCTTVSFGLAQEYKTNYNTHFDVVMSAAFYESELKPSSTEPDKIRMIHHGIAIPMRKLEDLKGLLALLDDRFTIDLMLVPKDQEYFDKIVELYKREPKVNIIPPVKPMKISAFINGYDIGFNYIPPINFNYLHALPNKIFDFVQARLAIAVGSSPEMATFVKKYDLGIVGESFEPQDLADSLNNLSFEKILYYKQQAHKHAKELSEIESRKQIQTAVTNLIQN